MSNSQQIQQYFNQAVQLMQRNDFTGALKIFVALENTGWKDFRLFRLTGIAYERLQRNKLACDYFKRSLTENPAQHDLFSSLARLQAALKNYPTAREWHQKAVSAAPGSDAYTKFAAFLLSDAVGEADEALSWLNKTGPEEANSERVLLLKARAYELKHEFEQQLSTLQTAREQFPDSKAVLTALAGYYNSAGQDDRAEQAYKDALARPHVSDRDWENLAMFLLGKQRADEAVGVVKKGLTAFPQSRTLLRLLSSLRYEMGEEDYLSDYRHTPLTHQPLPVALDYVDQSIKAGNYDQVAAVLQKLIGQHGNNPTIYQRVALLAYEQADYSNAIETFKALSEHTPENDNLKEWLVKALIADRRVSAAQPFITQLIDADPRNQIFWALQATAWRLTNDERYHWLCDYDKLVKAVPLITPSGYANTASFLDALKPALVALHTTQRQPLEQTLRQGTQTTGNLLDNSDPVLQSLREALHNTANASLSDLPNDASHPTLSQAGRKIDFSASWSVRLKDQGFHISHVHPKGWYSSAFYVDLPDTINESSKSGWLHLGKPGIAVQGNIDADHWIKPEPGKLALFPSFVWHGTEPFQASRHRLTVAFDLRAASHP
ncbi:tetratricopeptide repeat protein [Alteromonas antoniana]|uniref:tetratricopeptide repeat protein n=1 Tax=Alteromonas antoniana TaxID=2803813 RepID=UPI001C47BCCB|nr:tetratricopeptide repeat protein [Alteromonas antoniana]